MGGFNANVPARKPRTRIGQVLDELTSEEARHPAGEEALQPTGDLYDGEAPGTAPAADEKVADVPAAAAPAPTPRESRSVVTADSAHLVAGRERVAALRERLAQASRATTPPPEPKRAAAAVLEIVQDLRARLEETMQERAEMAQMLENMRAELGRTRTEVEKERKLRSAVEAQAEERTRIAADAVAEMEALAAERDQVLSELAEHRRLEDEQAALLLEAEAVLERRDEERATSARRISELREALEGRTVQLSDMESRLESAAADHARLEARCAELQAEVAGLQEAREALEALEATVSGRSRPSD